MGEWLFVVGNKYILLNIISWSGANLQEIFQIYESATWQNDGAPQSWIVPLNVWFKPLSDSGAVVECEGSTVG